MNTDISIGINSIDKREAFRYLGFGNSEPDEVTKKLADECEMKLLEAIKAKYIYKIFDLEGGRINEAFELKGDSVKEHLEGCSKVVFLCVTLSHDVDRLLRVMQVSSMAKASITDALASAAIEQVCEEAEKKIKKENPDYEFTYRYGLGYGDFPIEGQKDFLSILNAGKIIGVSVTDGNMLIPSKSVTCVMGMGHNLDKKHVRKCEVCSMGSNCRFRKEDDYCGK